MIIDGLVYFVAMTAFNALNVVVLLKTPQAVIQGSSVALSLQSLPSFLTPL